MSWDGYIDNLIARGAGNIDRASIIGLNGGGKWTTKQEVKLSADEAAKIAAVFTSKDFSSFQANGIMIEGQKYQFLRQEDGKIVYAKKKDFGSVAMQSSKQAIVIGHTPEGKAQGAAAVAVAAIAEYLEGLSY
jgi:profilin